MGSTRFAYSVYNQRITKYISPNGGLLRRSIVKCPEQDILWYRVVAVAAPGVAAKETAYREPQAFEGAVLSECLEGILGASRGEAA